MKLRDYLLGVSMDELTERLKYLDKSLMDLHSKGYFVVGDLAEIEIINNEVTLESFKDKIDYFIDACDTVSTKKLVIENCIKNNIKFITCLGTGKRLDPSKLTICDIRDTKNDPIARILRKYVKDSNIKDKVICCYSEEEPLKCEGKKIGSTAFVPSSAGLLIASYIIKDIIK